MDEAASLRAYAAWLRNAYGKNCQTAAAAERIAAALERAAVAGGQS